MTIKRKKGPANSKKRIVDIDGDKIKIMHVGFEVSESSWNAMQTKIVNKYGDMNKKSQIMRILVNAYVLGIVDIDDLDKKIEEAAKHVDEVIYI